jgi:hypothetical protein
MTYAVDLANQICLDPTMHCRTSRNGGKDVAHMQHVKYNYIPSECKADAMQNPTKEGQNGALPRHMGKPVTG